MQHIEIAATANNVLGESPFWHAHSRCLYWLDLKTATLFCLDPETHQVAERSLGFTPPLGAMVATSDPDIFALSHLGGVSLVNLKTRHRRALCDPEGGREEIVYNDMKVDRLGRLWIGTSHAFYSEPRGVLWCCDASGQVALADAGFAVSNGPAISPDGTLMYLADSGARRILRYDISGPKPRAASRRVLCAFDEGEGYPDGMTIDHEGCLWVAQWGGGRVSRFSPDGERLECMEMPTPNVTSVCFGGADYDTLYITSGRDGLNDAALGRHPHSGSVFSVKPGVTGVPEPLFSAAI